MKKERSKRQTGTANILRHLIILQMSRNLVIQKESNFVKTSRYLIKFTRHFYIWLLIMGGMIPITIISLGIYVLTFGSFYWVHCTHCRILRWSMHARRIKIYRQTFIKIQSKLVEESVNYKGQPHWHAREWRWLGNCGHRFRQKWTTRLLWINRRGESRLGQMPIIIHSSV